MFENRDFRDRCAEAIRRRAREGTTVVLESHDRDLVSELCTQALWLAGGTLVAQGPIEEILRRSDAATRAERGAGPACRRGRGDSTSGRRSRTSPARARGRAIRGRRAARARPAALGPGRYGARERDGTKLWFEQPDASPAPAAACTRSCSARLRRLALTRAGGVADHERRAETILGRSWAYAFSIPARAQRPRLATARDGWQPREGSWERSWNSRLSGRRRPDAAAERRLSRGHGRSGRRPLGDRRARGREPRSRTPRTGSRARVRAQLVPGEEAVLDHLDRSVSGFSSATGRHSRAPRTADRYGRQEVEEAERRSRSRTGHPSPGRRLPKSTSRPRGRRAA